MYDLYRVLTSKTEVIIHINNTKALRFLYSGPLLKLKFIKNQVFSSIDRNKNYKYETLNFSRRSGSSKFVSTSISPLTRYTSGADTGELYNKISK